MYSSTPHVLTKPEDGETLYLCIAISNLAVSGVLVKDDRGEQRPIFYVSKIFEAVEVKYSVLEKITFAAVTSA